MRHAHFLLMLVVGISLLPLCAGAQWQPNGVALSTAANSQQYSQVVMDGAGGAIVTWFDDRGGATSDIYAQRVDADGFAQWTPDGVALCNAGNEQTLPAITHDNGGGAIVTWTDHRDGAAGDIYIQRVDDTGTPLWTTNGVALCNIANEQSDATIAADNAGGAIVAWKDFRSGTTYDIYAQRVNASGIPQWTPGGVVVCSAANHQTVPKIVAVGGGATVVTWEDTRSGSSFNIYAQKLSDFGVPQWTANGVAVCSAPSIQPAIVQDGTGGAVVTFYRSPADIYVQRVGTSGLPLWTIDGVALCTAAGTQSSPAIVTAGIGGAMVTWMDRRNGTNDDIYTQRVNGSGVPQWAANGVALCTAANDQYFPTIVRDGANGAIVTWSDVRSGSLSDIYTQRVDNAGIPQWTTDGVALTTGGDGIFPAIVSDDAEGAIVTWHDFRNGAGADIYAQHVLASGGIPTAVTEPTSPFPRFASGIFPNPSIGEATLELDLLDPTTVRIDVFDIAGRALRSLDVRRGSGWQSIALDGRDDAGLPLPSGVYMVRATADKQAVTQKMVISR